MFRNYFPCKLNAGKGSQLDDSWLGLIPGDGMVSSGSTLLYARAGGMKLFKLAGDRTSIEPMAGSDAPVCGWVKSWLIGMAPL